jgi:hypothetical protein
MPRSLPYEIVAFQRIDGLAQVRSTGALHDLLFQPLEKSRRASTQWISLPGPFKGVSAGFVPLADVSVKSMGEFVNGTKAGILETFSLQKTEPNFNLVEPGGMGRSEVKLKTLVVSTIPVTSFCTVVSVQIVHHQMNLPRGVCLCDLIQERQKIRLFPGWITPAQHFPSAHIETSKQTGCAMADGTHLQ